MKSSKCAACGFVGWSDLEYCKACGAPMNQRADNFPSPAPTYTNQHGTESANKRLATTSLVLGIVNFLTWGLLGVGGVIGIVLGWKAMNRAKREPWMYGGHGMAIAGFVLSIVSLVSFAFLGLIAAIAVPNMFAARRAANEASAIVSVRAIASSESIYRETYNKYGSLEELAGMGLIDAQLATGTKNGYTFTVNLTAAETTGEGFEVISVPVSYHRTGNRSFYVDDSYIIRGADKSGRPSSNLDAPIGTYPSLNERTPRPTDYRKELVY